MKLTSFSSRHLLPLALAFGLAPLAASAQSTPTTATVINTVPYTITSSGTYIIGHDLTNPSTSAPAITINVANVVLDLNSYFVAGGGGSFNTVILVNSVSGVTIKNGTVADGPLGIYYGNTAERDETLSKVTITRCSDVGLEFDAAVMGGVITDCVFSSIGTANNQGFALYLTGGWRVENCVIDTVLGSGSNYGIYSNGGNLLIGNTISNCTNGIFGTSATTKFLNNLLYNCTTPFTGGTNATGNN